LYGRCNADKTRVFQRLVPNLSHRFLEHQINVKFLCEIRKQSMWCLCSVLLRLVGKLWKSEVVLSGTNCSKRTCMSKSQMKTMLITFFDMNSSVHFELIPQDQSTKLIMQKYWSCMKRKAWPLAQQLGSAPWQCSSSQDTLCQAVSVPEINYWNGTHPIPLIWLQMIPGNFQK